MQNRKSGNAQGIDVSHHQGYINWRDVAASGISFAIIKATQNRMDKQFIRNITEARKAGLLVGAYHFMDNSVQTLAAAKRAANQFYAAIVAGGGVDLPPVLDYESKAPDVTAAQTTAVAKAFMQEIELLTGKQPMIYTYPSFISNFNGLSQYPLWIARYSTKSPVDAQGWKEWEFWQYHGGIAGEGGTLPNSKQKIPGVAGPVDLNEFNGTDDQLRAKYSKQPAVKDPVQELEPLEIEVDYIFNGKTTEGSGLLINNTNYVPLRDLQQLFGFAIGFDNKTKVAMINGRNVQDGRLIDDITFVQAKSVVKAFYGKFGWDNINKVLSIKK